MEGAGGVILVAGVLRRGMSWDGNCASWGAAANEPNAARAHLRRGGMWSDTCLAFWMRATVLNLEHHRVR